MMVIKEKVYFFADATVNIEPTAEDLAEIAILSANAARRFGIKPRVAMLSFSNFGSSRHPLAEKVRQARELARDKGANILIDGEMQADTAVSPDILDDIYPFSDLAANGGANVLIFPNLAAGNIAYKLLKNLADAEAVGPILMGLRKPVHVLHVGGYDETDVVHMTSIAVLDAQANEEI